MTRPYKHCFVDERTNTIYLKEVGEKTFRKVTYDKKFFVQDSKADGSIKDIYGNPMKEVAFTKETVQTLRDSGLSLAESDLKPEVKYMHYAYDFEELSADINDWNIGFYDIEIQSNQKYPLKSMLNARSEEGEFPIRLLDITLKNKNEGYDPEVFDCEKKVWIKFSKSCYAPEPDFPFPEKAEYPINLITFKSTETKKTYTFGLEKYTGDSPTVGEYFAFDDELDMLKAWLKWFNSMAFDIFTGWNSEMFDLPYIVNRIKRLRTEKGIKTEYENFISPLRKKPELRDKVDPVSKTKIGEYYTIPAIYHLDYMELYKKFAKHPPLPSFSLNYIGNFELNKGKIDLDGAVTSIFLDNWNLFVEYNIQDVNLMTEIEAKVDVFSLIIEYAYDCLVNLDVIFNKIPTTEGYMLRYMHKHGLVMNDKKKEHKDWWREDRQYMVKQPDGSIYYQNCDFNPADRNYKEFKKFLYIKDQIEGKIEKDKFSRELWGSYDAYKKSFNEYSKDLHPFPMFKAKAGYCYDYAGRFPYCMSFDITSSYPHHIMMFNISPETKVCYPTKEQLESGEVVMSSVNNVGFKTTKGAILPTIVKTVFDERAHFKALKKEAKKNGDKLGVNKNDNKQRVKKEIINSMYGVCLASSFHLYDVDCARAITRCARVTLRDCLYGGLNKYYTSNKLINEVCRYFGTTKIKTVDHVYEFDNRAEINVLRNGEVITIKACDFNKETDLLGVEDET